MLHQNLSLTQHNTAATQRNTDLLPRDITRVSSSLVTLYTIIDADGTPRDIRTKAFIEGSRKPRNVVTIAMNNI